MSAINQCKWFDSTLHIFGLLSDGGVHSHIDHMFALLELARRNGLRKVCFHCFMDGRDTPPQSGIEYIDRLQNKIDTLELGCIATISGRYYAMDRDKALGARGEGVQRDRGGQSASTPRRRTRPCRLPMTPA